MHRAARTVLLLSAIHSRLPAASASAVHEVPFEIASNKAFVQVTVNGSAPQWFILDSGCAGGSVIARECADRLGIARGRATERHLGAGSGVSVGVSTAADAVLGLGEDTVGVASPRVFPLAHVARFEGRRVDGLVGEDFLLRHVVEIDYAHRRLRIRDPRGFTPPRGATVVPIALEHGLAVVGGAIALPGGGSIPCRFVIDTGVRATVILYRPFAIAHHLLDAPGDLASAVVGGGAGGETIGDVGRLAWLALGEARFERPTAVYSRDTVGVFASEDPDGIIGGELLRRCRVTFDYPHRRLMLERHRGPGAFEYDMSGLFLTAEGDRFDTVMVYGVTSGTPAAEAGVRPGDAILAIDGARAPDLTLERARAMLRTPGAHRLELERGNERREIRIEARPLV
ncbi:MAG TPA: aspartyl protease family protein [Candidatus Eisenbacteria bacterium]|nr:aspartyl protease family protein [Candidatus Eisenbacteria bacterium]